MVSSTIALGSFIAAVLVASAIVLSVAVIIFVVVPTTAQGQPPTLQQLDECAELEIPESQCNDVTLLEKERISVDEYRESAQEQDQDDPCSGFNIGFVRTAIELDSNTLASDDFEADADEFTQLSKYTASIGIRDNPDIERSWQECKVFVLIDQIKWNHVVLEKELQDLLAMNSTTTP